jgi:hypothetical protein
MGSAGWSLGLWDLLTALFYVVILVVPGVLFLVTLRALFVTIDGHARQMAPNLVWLNLIPGFNLGWFIYTVVKVRASLNKEYFIRGWAVDQDFGYRMGLTAGILLICLIALGWVPLINWVLGLVTLVCGGLYWIRIAILKRQLVETGPVQLHPISPPPFLEGAAAPKPPA